MKRFARFVAVFPAVFMLTGGTALAASPAKFYDATINGPNDCTGVGGTSGGAFGSARWKLAPSTSTVDIHVRGVSPSTSYTVIFADSLCTEHVIGTLTTDARGSGSGSFLFPTDSSGNFVLFPTASGDEYQTQEITF